MVKGPPQKRPSRLAGAAMITERELPGNLDRAARTETQETVQINFRITEDERYDIKRTALDMKMQVKEYVMFLHNAFKEGRLK